MFRKTTRNDSKMQEDTQMAIITISRPDLTPEERAKRMKAIKAAAVRLVVETEKRRSLKNGKK